MLRVVPFPGFLAGWSVSPFLHELPFADPAEALQLLPGWMREGTMPVRDAVVEAAAVAVNKFASDAAADAAQTNAAYAEGDHLDLIGARVLARAEAEGDELYRQRLLLGPGSAATPRAMLEAIDAIMAPFGKAGVAYYCELPEDDVWLQPANITLALDGTFTEVGIDGMYFAIDGVGSVVVDGRYYDQRTRCEPRHPFLWGTFRSPDTARTTIDGLAFDYSDAFNQHGHIIVGLPPFAPPTEDDEDACYVQSELYRSAVSGLMVPIAYLDADGNITQAALDLDASSATLFNITNEVDSTVLYESARDGATAVLAVQALLEARCSFPAQFTIVLDPELA